MSDQLPLLHTHIYIILINSCPKESNYDIGHENQKNKVFG